MDLPEFPWDALAEASRRAREHPGGIVDLSVGTPVDPTPEVIRRALREAADAPGYPQTWGSQQLRQAVSRWFARRRAVPGVDPDGVFPTIGSKEFVAWLPTLLGLGSGDVVVHPPVAYPTYDVGARIAGATPVPMSSLNHLPGESVRLVWVNSPSNPTGQVLDVAELARVVQLARQHGAVVASDECYAEFGWDGMVPVPPGSEQGPESGLASAAQLSRPGAVPSLLDPRVCAGSVEGLLTVYSLSKQSAMAGYRAGFVAGDPQLVQRLLAVRKHAGMIVPAPVQQAMIAALDDDNHVQQQRERYWRRRIVLVDALQHAGFQIDHSQAGLYLWATRGESAEVTVAALAQEGILVAPGGFYGAAGAEHVRVALTATDERVTEAAQRLVSR